MKKYKHPFIYAYAEEMGASGIRCPQIIEEPTDRRIPIRIEYAEGFYTLYYSLDDILDAKRVEFFALPTRERPRSIIISEDMRAHCEGLIFGTRQFKQAHVTGTINPKIWGVPFSVDKFAEDHIVFCDFEEVRYGTDKIEGIDWSGFDRGGRVPAIRIGIIGEHGPEAIHSIGPSHKDGLIRELVIQNDLRPVDKVYRSEAWTGRRPPISSPDLTLEEAWANFERELEDLFARSWVLRYGRTFFAVENYIDDDGEFRARTKFIFAIKRSRRKEIKREINNRNFWTRINYRFSSAGLSLRKAADNLSRDLANLTHKLRKDQKDG